MARKLPVVKKPRRLSLDSNRIPPPDRGSPWWVLGVIAAVSGVGLLLYLSAKKVSGTNVNPQITSLTSIVLTGGTINWQGIGFTPSGSIQPEILDSSGGIVVELIPSQVASSGGGVVGSYTLPFVVSPGTYVFRLIDMASGKYAQKTFTVYLT